MRASVSTSAFDGSRRCSASSTVCTSSAQLPSGADRAKLIGVRPNRLFFTRARLAVQLSRAPDGPELIKTIGICAGSGESVLKPQADLYLTGE